MSDEIVTEAFPDEPSFTLDDFRNWMNKQMDQPSSKCKRHELIGQQVESRISLKKLTSKIKSEEGDISEMAQDFQDYGGLVLNVHNNTATIEVDSGSFLIHKGYLKKSNN